MNSSSSTASIKTKLLSLLVSLLPLSIRIVFSRAPYVALAIGIAVIFWIIFNVFEQLLFFSPIWVFYLPEDAIIGFILTNITAILMGILVIMNVYVIKHSKLKLVNRHFLEQAWVFYQVYVLAVLLLVFFWYPHLED